jgi:hypothetical protein
MSVVARASLFSVVARASLFNEKKSASVHELGRTGGTGPRTDPNGREIRKDWDLLERLEAENLELRNRAAQLALQIEILRHVGRAEVRSARHCVRKLRK